MNRFDRPATLAPAPAWKRVLTTLPTSFLLVFGALPMASHVGLQLERPAAQEAEALSRDHIRLAARYAELSGANRLYINALNAERRDIIRALTSTNPDVASTITEVTDQVYLEMAETTGQLFEAIAEVYARTYPMEDLQVIVDFFQSDVGQRFLEVRRLADQEAFEATVAWGDQVSVTFLARVRTLLSEQGLEL
ncbi:MAG: DUF2059 domain-containing protein [Pseudomonadota bacterium]